MNISTLLVTDGNRPDLLARSLKCWHAQTVKSELVLIHGEQPHGKAMNEAFEWASGDICIVWDDDDLYAPDRIEKLIDALDLFEVMAIGTGLINYIDERNKQAWQYDNDIVSRRSPSLKWIGAPAFRRSAWEKYGPWEEKSCGADFAFLRKLPHGAVYDLRDPGLMLCTIHDHNAAGKDTTNPAWTPIDYEETVKGWTL